MKYPKEYLDEIKTRLKVSTVVSKTVSLKKRGYNDVWGGLYEFYNEEKKKLIKEACQINNNIKNLIKKNHSIKFIDTKTKLSHQEIFVSFIEIKLFNSHDFKKIEKKLDLFGANKKKLNMIAKPKVINEYLKKIS